MFTRDIIWERQNEMKPWHSILFLFPKSSPSHDHFYYYRNASQERDAANKSRMKDWFTSEKDIRSLWEIRHITEKPSSYILRVTLLQNTWHYKYSYEHARAFLLSYFTICGALTLPSITEWMTQKKRCPCNGYFHPPTLLRTTQSCLWKAASEEYRVGFKRGELQQESWMNSYFKLNNRIFNIVPMLPGSDLSGKNTQYFSF